MPHIRLLCVDDMDLITAALRSRIDIEPDMRCVGVLESADELISAIEQLNPDGVILDYKMPGRDPFSVVNELRERYPNVRTIFLSALLDSDMVTGAFEAGAWGCFSKADDVEEVLRGIRDVMSGRIAISSSFRDHKRLNLRTGWRPDDRWSAVG